MVGIAAGLANDGRFTDGGESAARPDGIDRRIGTRIAALGTRWNAASTSDRARSRQATGQPAGCRAVSPTLATNSGAVDRDRVHGDRRDRRWSASGRVARLALASVGCLQDERRGSERVRFGTGSAPVTTILPRGRRDGWDGPRTWTVTHLTTVVPSPGTRTSTGRAAACWRSRRDLKTPQGLQRTGPEDEARPIGTAAVQVMIYRPAAEPRRLAVDRWSVESRPEWAGRPVGSVGVIPGASTGPPVRRRRPTVCRPLERFHRSAVTKADVGVSGTRTHRVREDCSVSGRWRLSPASRHLRVCQRFSHSVGR